MHCTKGSCAGPCTLWTLRNGQRGRRRQKQQQQQKKKQQLEEQQKEQQVEQKPQQQLMCISGVPTGERTATEEAAAAEFSSITQSIQQRIHLSVSVEETISEIINTHPRSRRRRPWCGFRPYCRKAPAPDNYYAIPFPPPETLRLHDDEEDDAWQDIEVRVIGHDGIVVWQDLQTPDGFSDSAVVDGDSAQRQRPGRRRRRRRRRGRKFHNGVARCPRWRTRQFVQSRAQTTRTTSTTSALLTIEATIVHGPGRAQALPLPPPTQQQQLLRTPQLPSSAVVHLTGSRKPAHLMEQLRLMHRTQRMEAQRLEQEAWQTLRPRLQNQLQLNHNLEPSMPSMTMPSLQEQQLSMIPLRQPTWQQQQHESQQKQQEKLRDQHQPKQQHPLQRQPQQQRQPSQQQPGNRQHPNKQEQKLRRKLLQSLQHQMLQRQSEARAIDEQRTSSNRNLLPSYMRPYSPVLHYPTASKLPVPNRCTMRAPTAGN